ncbi:transcriptional regulator [Pasteurellaceae bacterium Macca]|nr:transcriptional regulator [Pasteurellaceae bacterium Macca]
MKMTSTDHKYHHLGSVYRLVEQFELISRTDLAKLAGVAPASMTMLTKALIDHKLILERTSQNLPSRGRPAVGLSVSTFHWHYLCLTITPNKLSIALCDLTGNAVHQLNYTFSASEYPTFDAYLLACLNNFTRHMPLDSRELIAVSVSVVGKVNKEKTAITQLGNVPLHCPLTDTLSTLFSQPILLNEHFQLWFLLESTLGSLIGDDNVIFLQLDDTVELSVLLKGALLHQNEHKRMNVDKMIMPKFSPLSLEIADEFDEIHRYQLANQITFPALVKLIDRYLPNELEEQSAKIHFFCQQVEAENLNALRILNHISDNLAYMLMNLINIFSTEKIMINSPLLQIKQALFAQLHTKLAQNLLLDDLHIDLVTSHSAWDNPQIPAVAIKLGLYDGHLLRSIMER